MNDEERKHDLVCKIKQLASELGTTPTNTQFVSHIGDGAESYRRLFGGWNQFINAAGLVPNRVIKKINNSIFEVNIERHLEEYEPKLIQESSRYPKILIVGDLHFPFFNEKALEKVHVFSKIHQPKYIVQIGDLFDMYSFSKFPRSHNIYTPKNEEELARQFAEKMWIRFHLECPNAKLIQCTGNHDYRVMKRTLEALPSAERWIEKYLKELLTFDSVETIFDPRGETKIEDITFVHGFLSGLGKHRDHFIGNVVCGHSHSGGVVYKQINHKVQFELNVGYLGDENSKALSYTATRTVPWTLGHGFIDEYGPRFIPF